MANFTASVKINASSNLSKVALKTKSAFDRMSKSIDKTSFKMTGFNDDVRMLTRRLGQLAVAGFGAAIVKGSQFETSLKDLSALTGLVGDELNYTGNEAIDLSKKYGVAASSVVSTIKKVGSARSELLKDPQALLKISEQAIILSKAARIDLSSAVEAVTTSMNQFTLETSDANRVINVLAAGSKVGASEIADTATAISRAGVAMKIAGVSFEDGNAAIQVLAKNGIKAERAGTALKTALLKLTSEGIDQINPKVVGLEKSLENLAAANLDAAQLTDLFGLESIAAGKILIDNRRLLGEWTKEMTGTTTATKQANTNMDTFGERLKRLGSIITADFIQVFQNNEGTLSELVDQMILDFDKFKPVEQIFQGIADTIELVIRGVQTLSGGLGRLAARLDSEDSVIGKLKVAADPFYDPAMAARLQESQQSNAEKISRGTLEIFLAPELKAGNITETEMEIMIEQQLGSMLPATP